MLKEAASPVFIFLVNVLLVFPLFTGEYTQHMGSIESAFIADAEFIDANGLVNWSPLWYFGFPFHLTYTPLIPHLIAALHWLIQAISIPRFYRLITALAYASGPVTLYLFVRYLTRRELTAFTSAIIYSVALMPIYAALPFTSGLVNDLRYVPYNLIALTFFGEGPHILGLAATPLAALALLHLLREPRLRNYVLASLAVAVVALANLIAFYAFALIALIIVFSEALRGEAWRKIRVALTCGAISYGLIAFHYDASFIKASVSFGVSGGGGYVLTWLNLAEAVTVLSAALLGLGIYLRGKAGSQPLFVAGAWTLVFLTIPSLWYFFNIPLAPQPGRYIPELNIGVSILLGLAAVNILDRFTSAAPIKARLAWRPLSFMIIVVAILMFPFVQSTWSISYPNRSIGDAPEYRVAKWLEEHARGQRVYATGTVCFWLNAFTPVLQVRGGSDQGSTNPWWIEVAYEMDNGEDARLGVLWSRALGLRYITVIYLNADTPYHDYAFPNKFEKILPLRYAYEGFAVFEVPSVRSELIQAVDSNIQDLIKNVDDVEGLTKYVGAIEAASNAKCSYRFEGVDRVTVSVTDATESTAILVKMTFDQRWKAYVSGGEIPIVESGPNFMLIKPERNGSYELKLICDRTTSETMGIATSIATTLIILAAGMHRMFRRLPRPKRF